MKNIRKKSVVVLAGLAATGLVGASAATLGGVRADNLGADVGVVASCDTDGVDVAFSTSFVDGITQVDTVTVSGIDAACDTQVMTVALARATGTGTNTLATSDPVTLSIPATPGNVVVTAFDAAADAEFVNRVSITISGTPAP